MMNNNGTETDIDVSDVVLEFYECVIHAILKARQVYPEHLFTQRMKYGITVWQCLHPEINSYIHRVILNCRELLSQGVVSRLMIVNKLPDDNTVVDIISLATTCHFCNISFHPQLHHFQVLEEEFRSVILKAALLDNRMLKFDSGIECTLLYSLTVNIYYFFLSNKWFRKSLGNRFRNQR